jgi:hypothetical protein
VVKQCIPFILACYGDKDTDSANDARYNLWMMKVSKNVALPATDGGLWQNVARAHSGGSLKELPGNKSSTT